MNKNLILPVAIVIVLGLGLWWFASNTNPEDIKNSLTPSVSSSAGPLPSGSASPSSSPTVTAKVQNITITSPKANEAVDAVFTVTGKARVFENQFTVQMKTSAGEIVFQSHVMSDAKQSGVFGNSSVKIPVPAGLGSNFTVESLAYSAKGDGSFEGFASVPIKLKSTAESKVYVAFTTGNDCTTVTLFPRTVYKSTQPAFMSLAELLVGPAPSEVAQGAGNQIPNNVQINSLRIEAGTAYANFNETLDQGVAGSCRVQAIRAQITETLKQFLGVINVVISINGRTEDILQP